MVMPGRLRNIRECTMRNIRHHMRMHDHMQKSMHTYAHTPLRDEPRGVQCTDRWPGRGAQCSARRPTAAAAAISRALTGGGDRRRRRAMAACGRPSGRGARPAAEPGPPGRTQRVRARGGRLDGAGPSRYGGQQRGQGVDGSGGGDNCRLDVGLRRRRGRPLPSKSVFGDLPSPLFSGTFERSRHDTAGNRCIISG